MTGWPRHRENREFGCSFFQKKGQNTGNLPKNIKNMNLHRGHFEVLKLKDISGLWWDVAMVF